MQFPVFTSALLVVLITIALLVSGISSIIQGISKRASNSSSLLHRRRSSEYCSIYSSDSTSHLRRIGFICYYDLYCIFNKRHRDDALGISGKIHNKYLQVAPVVHYCKQRTLTTTDTN